MVSTYHEVALLEFKLMRQTLFCSVVRCSLDLVLADCEARHMTACELDDLTSRTANTASDVQHLHVLLQTHVVCQEVLVTGNGLCESFSVREAAEVEGRAPAVLVQICGEVVVPGQRKTISDD